MKVDGDRMKAVIYARVSSREQKEGYSLEAQLKLGKDYSERQQIDLIREFAVAEIAKNGGREQFEQMISFLKQNTEVKVIICEKVDRLLRGDLKDRVAIDDLLRDYDKEIHFVKENIVLSKDSKSFQKLYYGIQAEFARFYLNNLSDEVRKSYDVMVEEGRYPHPPPIGYKPKLENHLSVPDPSRVNFIIKAFELASTGNASLYAIVDQLYKEGFRSRTGKKVGKSEISRLLHNPFYYGDFLWKGEVKKGIHQPLVSKSLYEKVQAALSPRGRNKGVKHRFTYAGGLITCGYCGSGITAEIQKGHIYYRCTKPKGAKSCPSKYVREEKIEAQLTGIIEAINLNNETVEIIKDILHKSHEEEEQYHKQSLDALQTRYNGIKTKLDKLLDAYIDGAISKDIYMEKSKDLEQERSEINSEISRHKNADKAFFEHVEGFLEVSYQAPSLFKSSSPELKRELLKYIVSNLVLEEKKLVPTYRLPFNLLVEYRQNENLQGWSESNTQSRFWRPLVYR